ncbi:hypothetical protein [Nonomuraea dietziae]|uniref:hypothetical protein n=1 Tax=Nonomuraea dietziae TaxID=65515 RepID=UPI0031CDE674
MTLKASAAPRSRPLLAAARPPASWRSAGSAGTSPRPPSRSPQASTAPPRSCAAPRYRAGWIVLPRPDGNGFIQVGAMVKDGEPVPVPTITPGSPVTIDGDTVAPKDVDAFIEEMS